MDDYDRNTSAADGAPVTERVKVSLEIDKALVAGDIAKARQLVQRLNSLPAGVFATPATIQSRGSKLEFRIAPKSSDLDKAELASYMDWLKAGKVGFWWKDNNKEWKSVMRKMS